MNLTRQPGWEERLRLVLQDRAERAFDLRTNDCVKFTADCVLAMTGTDPAANFRAYATRWEARRLLAPYGGLGPLLQRIFLEYGCERVNWQDAHWGDPVYYAAGLQSVGICQGNVVLSPMGDKLAVSPLYLATCAWRIP